MALGRLLKMGALAALLAVAPERSSGSIEPGTAIDLDYDMRVGGVRVARIELRVEAEEERRFVDFQLANVDWAAWVAGKHRTTMQTEAVEDGNGRIRPLTFAARYDKPDRVREIDLDYDDDGGLADIRLLNNDREKESEVPPELRVGTVDPLTAFLQLQNWLASGPKVGSHVVVPVFEGRKRADIEVHYRGLARLPDSNREVHHLSAALIARSGFDRDDEMMSWPDEEERNWLETYVSLEDDTTPILIETSERRLPTWIALSD